MKILRTAIGLLLVAACSQGPSENTSEEPGNNSRDASQNSKPAKEMVLPVPNLKDYLIDSSTIAGEYLAVSKKSVIYVYPTEKQRVKMDQEWGQATYKKTADGYAYYRDRVNTMLGNYDLEKHYATNRIIKFVGPDTNYWINLDKPGMAPIEYWAMILYNPGKEPFFINMPTPNVDNVLLYLRSAEN